MYGRRLKILIALGGFALVVCVLRIAGMQLLSGSFYSEQIAALKLQKGSSRQLRTMRGRILDRNGRVLAVDEPRFQMCIQYELSQLLDERVKAAAMLAAEKRVSNLKSAPEDSEAMMQRISEEWDARAIELNGLVSKCTSFGANREYLLSRLFEINDRIWNLRMFIAWVRNEPNDAILEKHGRNLNSIPLSEAIADFEKSFPDTNERLMLVEKVRDIADMTRAWPLFELADEDDVFAAQVEFLDVNGVEISAQPYRVYPYGSAASQIIGWVGPPTAADRAAPGEDGLASYLADEVCGREDGVEYVCERILRGRRGEIVYDIDGVLVRQAETQHGQDVRLTIDIELQQRIQDYLSNCGLNQNCALPVAAAVIDVNSGDILAMPSMPVFDLNRVRHDYGLLAADANEPLRNRAINKHYAPGSVVKPLILIAGMESGKITAEEVISCPAQSAPFGWPNCWIYNQYHWLGHDGSWANHARNAIRGSCNIYFSRLADRIDPLTLQSWLFRFGYGHRTPLAPHCGLDSEKEEEKDRDIPNYAANNGKRDFRQAQGQVSSNFVREEMTSVEQLPNLEKNELRLFGIGHGNFRVTVLQVAQMMAAIARGGSYKDARLIADCMAATGDEGQDAANEESGRVRQDETKVIDLGVSQSVLAVVYDGMRAVVDESGGTAFKAFEHSGLDGQGVKVYGKTGSTQDPENAWFAGFAKDRSGRGISIALVVEGGQEGSSDAAPLARDIIQFCTEAGYVGN